MVEPTAGHFDGRVHYLPVRIYWEDTDASGIVYHANYLRYFERARSDFLRLAGVDQGALLAEATAFVVRSMVLDYQKPARLDDALEVRTALTDLSGARLTMRQEVFRAAVLLVSAEVRAACIDPIGKPKRIPAAIAGRLATLSPNS